jgi:hypothetical protein
LAIVATQRPPPQTISDVAQSRPVGRDSGRAPSGGGSALQATNAANAAKTDPHFTRWTIPDEPGAVNEEQYQRGG